MLNITRRKKLHQMIIRITRIVVLIIAGLILCINGFSQTKVMSFNLRYDNPNDAENCWGNRKGEVVQLIDSLHPDIFGIQEGLFHQLEYINGQLTDYTYVGVGRDDGKEKGEFAAIFYDSLAFSLIETTTFWLSSTPDRVSVGWNASMERICTYGAFINNNTNDSLFIFNCHFDHIGEISRNMSAKLILNKIKEFGLSKNSVVVMGDLNSEPQDEPIQTLREELDDAIEISEQPHYGLQGTFNSFDTTSIATKRIDYIFTKNMIVRSHRHIDYKRKNRLYFSDHFPVLVEIIASSGSKYFLNRDAFEPF